MQTPQIATATSDAAIRAQIARLSCASKYPQLTDDDLDNLLLCSKRIDKFGRSILDPNWMPTYNVNYSVALGWDLKAGYAAGDFDYKDAQMQFDRSQVMVNCEKMAAKYRKKLAGSIPMIAPQRSPIAPIQTYPVGPTIMPTEFEQGNL
jgi:hypothetical protein